MMVTPEARSARTTSHMSLRNSTSTPAVGSSSNTICGSCDSALAISTRRFMPPDSVMIFWSFLSYNETSLSPFSMQPGLVSLRQMLDGDDGLRAVHCRRDMAHSVPLCHPRRASLSAMRGCPYFVRAGVLNRPKSHQHGDAT